VPVQVCKMVPMEETVRVPRIVERRTPVIETYRVPRTIVFKVPIDPCTGADLAVPAAVGAPMMPAMPGLPTSTVGPASPTTTFQGGAGSGAQSAEMPPVPKESVMTQKKDGAAGEGTGANEETEKKSSESDVQKDKTVQPGLDGTNPVPPPSK